MEVQLHNVKNEIIIIDEQTVCNNRNLNRLDVHT